MTIRNLKHSFFVVVMLFASVNAFAQDYAQDSKKSYNIIKYANCVLGLSDTYTAPLGNYQNMLNVADHNVAKLQQDANTQPSPINYSSMLITKSEVDRYMSKIDSITPFDQKNSIDQLMNKAIKSNQKVADYCSKINNYFTQGQYKDDRGFSGYKAMKDSLTSNISKTYSAWNNASQSATNAANGAEIDMLKYNNRAEFLVPMKTDISTFKEILNMFGTSEQNYAQIRQKTQTLSYALNQDKELSGKNLSKLKNSSYQTVYQNFYQYCITGVSAISTLTQKMEQKASSAEIQDAYSQVRSAYSNAINAYNTFVKQ